jgi:2,4'-dihydroxyacetophenone dioxygenase
MPKEVITIDTKKAGWQPIQLENFPTKPPAYLKMLEVSKETGGVTCLIKFPKGFVEPRHSHSCGHMVYVVSGDLGSGKVFGKDIFPEGTYWSCSAGDTHGPLKMANDCVFFFITDGPLNFKPA